MKIVKNFLNEDSFNAIEKVLFKPRSYFPWYLSQGVSELHDGFSQLTHTFFQHDMKPNVNSPYYDLIIPVLKILKPKQLYRIKANLLFKTHVSTEHGYHVDYADCTTSILYLDTNNGYTKFKKSKNKIKSERNKLVSFDSNLEHTGATCTNKPYRTVINFNYII